MIAQVTLTPVESKKLIAKAIVRLNIVQKALNDGIVVLHPSSSTFFIVEEITGNIPTTKIWVCGAVFPKGTCSNREARKALREHPQFVYQQLADDPRLFPFSWAIRGTQLETGGSLGSLLAEMGEGDVFIKGVNALDVGGKVGILFANMKTPGGTFGQVLAASRKKRFKVIFPAGLEKLIPVPVKEAAKRVSPRRLDYSMGQPCGLLPCEGIVVTEPDAIRILSGGTAIPIAAGGISGAEGAVTLVVEGDKQEVELAIQYVNQVKGAKLPLVQEADCARCDRRGCSLAGTAATFEQS